MPLEKVKSALHRIDNRIVTLLMKTGGGGVNGLVTQKSITLHGDTNMILNSINEYDKAVLTRLVIKEQSAIRRKVLRVYTAVKARAKVVAREGLGVARKVKRKIKNVS